jgi:hypothetical protein
MLKHDEYWNWSVKKGDKIVYTEKTIINEFYPGEEYDVVIPQCTPRGICVQDKNGKQLLGEHDWFQEKEI